MSTHTKKLSNPFSTGGGGGHFEAHVQASFVALMLTGGFAPCLPCWPIKEIKLQGKVAGYNTDDLIVFIENIATKEPRKILGQVKHSISITQRDSVFSEVMHAAWTDFNNSKVFSPNKDIIALITGPLNATDFQNVHWLLDQARHTKCVDEFYRNVKQANFSPSKSEEKLEVIRHHLKLANKNREISDDILYSFLKCFHLLGYDLGKEVGVVLSLLHSHIRLFNQQDPQMLWSRIVDIVQTWNQDAGTITMENLPDDLKDAFKQPTLSHIPAKLTLPKLNTSKTSWNQNQYATTLALANLIGGWSETNEADTEIVNRITNESYSIFIQKAREVLQIPDSIFSLHQSIWNISNRVTLWNELGPRLFDSHLDVFKEIVVLVLTERNPAFDLSADKRYAANIYEKTHTYSSSLRKGLAESLALLGNQSEALIHCSLRKAEVTANLAIREILTHADWRLWGSLNHLHPTLAEAAPNEFLEGVEKSLADDPCPFIELFTQEGAGITGTNYLTGLLWALETLAWGEEYLNRICIILGELASHDPGGNWLDRPINSLTTILLPWLPQTIASIEKRKVAVQTLYKEFPDVAWKLIISLLPNNHQSTTGSQKPKWRNTIPEEWEKGVSEQEYWEQVLSYAELAVSMASHDTNMLLELIDNFPNLPKPSFDQLLEYLSSDTIISIPEEQRLPIWKKLTSPILKHQQFTDTYWALDEDSLDSLKIVTNKMAPSKPKNLHQRLFTMHEYEHYEENDDWQEQHRKINKQRQDAIKEILCQDGIYAVIQFSEIVESPSQVGHALADIGDEKIDKVLLPAYLGTDNQKLNLSLGGYIWNRHHTLGWPWADNLEKYNWNSEQICQFLLHLPFSGETWTRVTKWLESSQSCYWEKVTPNPYLKDDDLTIAIQKLIEHQRPFAAITCLIATKHKKNPIDIVLCVKALTAAISSTESPSLVNNHEIVELIKLLQENPLVMPDDLFPLEWAYLPLLKPYNRTTPKTLESHLSNDPDFYCEVIRTIYRSDKDNTAPTELSEETKAIVNNAWQLLHNWQIPPGMQKDGSFDGVLFLNWLQHVKKLCLESGHLEVALNKVGDVLIHCPSDLNGLWINRTVAEALNAKDAEEMRCGFQTGLFNSRGVHWMDPAGKPELELAKQYRQKAEEVENAGFQRLAVTLRSLAESYDRDAERIANEHKFRVHSP